MPMAVEVLTCDQAALRFGEIWPVLSRSVERDGTETAAAICAKVSTGVAVIAEVDGGRGFAVLEILQYPGRRILHISHVAGEGLDDWLEPAIEWWKRYAVEQHCDAVRYHGRKGWSRLVPGFREVARVYEFDVRNCQ